jgi:hypothetical protein
VLKLNGYLYYLKNKHAYRMPASMVQRIVTPYFGNPFLAGHTWNNRIFIPDLVAAASHPDGNKIAP